MQYEDKVNLVVLGIIGRRDRNWHELEYLASSHPLWPGFDQGPPRAVADRAVKAGWVKLNKPSGMAGSYYSLTEAGHIELERLRRQKPIDTEGQTV